MVDNINLVLRHFDATIDVSPIHLPIGISFFTFQAISYVIDVYRSDVKSQKSLLNFSMYKALFPQLIAGPIVRYRDIEHQIETRAYNAEKFATGIRRFIIGLGKKVIIANNVAIVADQIFSIPSQQLSFPVVWLGIICYALQIYFDFSGYSDMAIGLGKMLGFDFLENFNYPYISKSIREFWRRWHISLSSWFRDYLYIPLGGNRGSRRRTFLNNLIVFFLCGLWHGASWTFVIWGLWHGLFLIFERTAPGKLIEKQIRPIQYLYTTLVVLIGWVFFRADNLSYAISYLKAMAGFGSGCVLIAPFINVKTLFALGLGLICMTPAVGKIYRKISLRGNIPDIRGRSAQFIYAISYIFIFAISLAILSSATYNPFIYFRF